MNSPLEQFKINPIIRIYNNWIDLTITNSTIFIIISILIIFILFTSLNNRSLIGNKNSQLFQLIYLKLEEIINEIIGKRYNKYIPLMYSIFIFILLNNIIGLIPYSFTTTSHFIITMTMSLTIMIGVTLIGFFKYSYKFFYLFIPNGLNQGFTKYLIPFIFIIELISYLARILSLAIRLAANLISGHTLLNIIGNFGFKYTFLSPYIFIIIPILFIALIFLLEIGIALIQAYVFTLLTITYIKDAELLH